MNIKIFNPNQWSLNNFSLGRRLGSGNYGNVYLAKQKKSRMILAIKVLSKKRIQQHQSFGLIRRQVQIHSHIRHENILSMYGYFYDNKNMYIILEYCTQGDLYKYLFKHKKFDQKTVKNYMKQMVNAVHYLQKLNIIHRDIKPENIMVSDDNTLKLSDFGWSIKTRNSSRKTFCGTPDYFCPEIIRYKPFDYKIDNWSLGILAYELLFGKPPFYSPQQKDMFRNILRSQIEFPEQASEDFKDFVVKLTKKDPKQRMQLSDALNHPWFNERMDIENEK